MVVAFLTEAEDNGNAFKKIRYVKNFVNKEVFCSLKREESIKNGLEALGALLHIEIMLQR